MYIPVQMAMVWDMTNPYVNVVIPLKKYGSAYTAHIIGTVLSKATLDEG